MCYAGHMRSLHAEPRLVVADEASPLTRDKLVEAIRQISKSSTLSYDEAWHYWHQLESFPPTPEQELMDRINARLRSVE